MRQKALKAVRAKVPAIIAKYRAVKSAYVFGSILRPGAFLPDSGIDIAIEGGSAENYFALWNDLEETLPDWLIDLRDLPPDTRFTEQVRLRGEKIYNLRRKICYNNLKLWPVLPEPSWNSSIPATL